VKDICKCNGLPAVRTGQGGKQRRSALRCCALCKHKSITFAIHAYVVLSIMNQRDDARAQRAAKQAFSSSYPLFLSPPPSPFLLNLTLVSCWNSRSREGCSLGTVVPFASLFSAVLLPSRHSNTVALAGPCNCHPDRDSFQYHVNCRRSRRGRAREK
jgi:hypothetical protein